MSDYKIRIGTELDTSGIDQKVKNYQGNVEVSSTLDTSGITKTLNVYKPKPLNVNTKLSTTGLTKAIKNYKAKDIRVKIDPIFDGIDGKIESHTINTPLRVKVDINWTGVKGQIANPTEDLGKVYLDAELNDETIGKAIRDYKATTPIKVDIDPQFDEAATKISSYQMRNMLKVNVKLNKTAIDSQIKNFQASKYIEVGAKLRDNAIENAITKYTAKELVPITVDFTLGNNKEVSQKIIEYKNTPVEVPVKLIPAKTGFSDKITTTPVKVSATVDPADIRQDIESAVGGYTPTAKMPVNIKLTMPKDINSQVISLGSPTEPIDVNVRLDGSNINADIALFKPTATLGVKPDLIFENIEEEIRNYIPHEKVKVHLDLIDSDINAEAGKQKTQNPITVNVKLDPDGINKQIKDLKPSAKVKVGVQLDFASHKNGQIGVPQQIKEYKTKSKIKVGVELDKDDVGQQIQTFKTDTPIRLGVELDPDGVQNVQNQINNIRQRIQDLGNININLGGRSANGNDGANSNNGNNGGRSSRKQSDDIDDTVRAYRELISLQNRIGSHQQKVARLGLNTSENQREILALSNTIDDLIRRYQRIHQLFNGRFNDTQTDALNRGFQKVSENLNIITAKARDARDALARNINVELGNGGFEKQIVKIEDDINRLQSVSDGVRTAMDEVRLAFGLMQDASANGNVDDLIVANRLYEESLKAVKNQLDINKVSNNSAVESQTKAYKELLSISKEIGSLETNIEKLKLQGGNSSQIEVLENQLRALQSTYRQLLTTMETPLTYDQWSSIYTQIVKTSDEVERLKAKHADARAEFAKDIKINIDNGGLQNKINAVTQKFNKLGIVNRQVTDDIAELQRLLGNMDASDDIESVTADYQAFLQLLKTVNNGIDNLQMQINEANRPELLNAAKESAMQKLNGLFEDGSQAARVFGSRAQELRNELNQVGNVKGVDIINKKIKSLGTEIKNSNLQTKTFSTRLKEQFSKYTQYLSIASVFMYASQAARSMFEQVKLIDSAMTELKKVTDETDASYNKFLSNAATRAKEIGTTIDGLVASTADFARLGYGFEDSQKLAEVANIYAVVGDEIEGVEGATESLISTLAAFKDETSGISDADFAMNIIDIFNELGNKFAISSGGLGEALERSASSLNAANNTIHESAALITAANEVVVLCHAA